VPSHKLLVRAGYVRRVAPGIYSWLPLGLRVLRAVEQVVREEMDAMGAQEIQFPALLPREPYETTHRWTEYGPNIFRLKDRKGGDYLLGPTHEELFTLVVKGEYASYKDYPVVLYQIQTKYRDEERPRAGILRGREFLMKDSYSFDLTDEGLAESYAKHRDAYIKIFDRLGLGYVIVSAMSGAMGGSASEEFLAESETGEDTFRPRPRRIRRERRGGHHARAPRAAGRRQAARAGAPHARYPDDRDAGRLPERRGPRPDLHAADTLKNVLIKTRLPGADGWELLAVGVPGDREVDMKRLEAALFARRGRAVGGGRLRGAPVPRQGVHRPGVLAANGVRFLVDPRIVTGTAWVTGADKADHHVVDLVVGRDFTPDGTIEAAEVRAGDPSPDGTGVLEAARGSRSGTSSSSAASTPTPSPSTRSARTASPSGSPWAPTGSVSRAWWPRSPSRATTSTAWSGRARSRRSTCTWSRGKQAEIREGAEALAASSTPRASGAARRPDGVAGGEVRRRRAGRRPDDRRGRPRARVRGDRGQGPEDRGADGGRARVGGRAPGGADGKR
jgi:prolyl-tRNA synthetase